METDNCTKEEIAAGITDANLHSKTTVLDILDYPIAVMIHAIPKSKVIAFHSSLVCLYDGCFGFYKYYKKDHGV